MNSQWAPDGHQDDPDATVTVEVDPAAVLAPHHLGHSSDLVVVSQPGEASEPMRPVTTLIDGPDAATRLGRPAAPRPILPAWVKSWSAFLDAMRWWLRHAFHVSAFHGIRLPVYWLRLVARAPIGVARILGALWRWSTDPDGRAVRSAMKTPGSDPAVFIRLTEQRRGMVRTRLLVTTVGTAVIGTAAWLLVASTSLTVIAAASAGLLTLLGVIGRSADRPVTSRAVDSEAVPRLTADLIVTALGSLGIAELNKALKPGVETGVRFPAPIMRDGPGFRAEVDLPPGSPPAM